MDLATLVTEGMKLIGRGDLVPETAALDNHSTISLSLGEQQVIHIAVVDEYPVIWMPLQTDLPALLPEVKGGLLDILTEEPAPLFYPGSPALRQTDNGAELVGCFSHNAVSGAEPFVQALDQFVRLCQQCHTLILRG
ncbi:Type III secretion system protein BsaR [Morganella morganii]|uniref:InvB/SpaK family type III secretion system chaperone n=1 Tax=Morganella morganii TaxID=582 RepID=UPI000509ACE8|nr:type III secretion system protein BsaR [Morganella morganii]AUT99172.1 Type III secretion system protein BsaR [Morganella morganii]AVD58624.1 Type III secretion system protein BsaR [Morganella morganii]EHZ6679251.1 Type III secretion system protein BsaR [Morganella morganii]EKU4003742.1 Type III secretion system protein BsaR [Morganella morganii]EKU8062348.1 Type III secretion system protein BsaR [Morganella morganii]